MGVITRIHKAHKNSPFQFLVHTIFSPSSYHSSALAAAAATSPSAPSPALSSPSIEVISRSRDIIYSFKEWFKTGNDDLLDRIFKILNTHDEISANIALSRLNLHLNEIFVLEVLHYGKDVLSCLKFFDWAGRQNKFVHTRATFHAIYKVLSKEKLMSLMLDFLVKYREKSYVHNFRFHDTLVMGYAVAGKPEVALQLLAKMRYQGLDLDVYGYQVLLNALVEEDYFEACNDIAKQVRLRGLENEITHGIVLKSFCKQKLLREGEEYLRDLVRNGGKLNGRVLSVLVDAFCTNREFERAGRLMDEFKKLGIVSMEPAYNVWIRELVRAGRLDGAIEFLKSTKLEGCVPDVFQYNVLIFKLLKKKRLEEALDYLMEMKEREICPDQFTMNAALCFFCKAGMAGVALELYNTREEFNLSPNSMAYNYLINTLCGEGNINEAYKVLKTCVGQGHLPGANALSILAQNVRSGEKIDILMDVFITALEYGFIPSWAYNIFASALCRAEKFEDCYVIYRHLVRLKKSVDEKIYYRLINGLNKTNRGDIAARIFKEMLESGRNPLKELYRAVITNICKMDNPEARFFNLLEMSLSHQAHSSRIYNVFIDGAGYAGRHDLAQLVFDVMVQRGFTPNVYSYISLLRSYIRCSRFSDALNIFRLVSGTKMIGRKMYNAMVIGLSKQGKLDIALDILKGMRANGATPSTESYEELIKALCSNRQFDHVVFLLEDLEKGGRTISSFIGNVVVYNLLEDKEAIKDWYRVKDYHDDDKSRSHILDRLVGAVSSLRANDRFEEMEKLIQSCFQPDLYTYNSLLRWISRSDIDLASKYFMRIREKGYEPNRWSYDILAHGLLRHGRITEGKRCIDVMRRNGFSPSGPTERLSYYR